MAADVPVVQIIYDSFDQAIVKITAYYDAATASNTLVVQANSLYGANASSPKQPILSASRIQFVADISGYARLEWVNASSNANNSVIYALGSSAADLACYVPNPFLTSNASSPCDISLTVVGAGNNDSFTLILTLNKDNSNGGWANGYAPLS